MSNGVFNFNFLSLVFSEILGGPKFTLGGPTPPGRPYQRNFFTKASTSQYVIVFNFNILALVVSEILGGPKFTLGGTVPPVCPRAVCTRGEYVTMSNGVFNFNFLALLLSEILGGSQIYTRGPTPPGRQLAEKFLYPKRVLHNI